MTPRMRYKGIHQNHCDMCADATTISTLILIVCEAGHQMIPIKIHCCTSVMANSIRKGLTLVYNIAQGFISFVQ